MAEHLVATEAAGAAKDTEIARLNEVMKRPSGPRAPALTVTPIISLNVSVHSHERQRLRRQCYAILDRLRQGPASNHDLAAIALKYTGRLSELYAAGYDIRKDERDYSTGRVVYRLVAEP